MKEKILWEIGAYHKEDYDALKETISSILQESGIKAPKVEFNDEKNKILMGYNKIEISEIFAKSPLVNPSLFSGSFVAGVTARQPAAFEKEVIELKKETGDFFLSKNLEIAKKSLPTNLDAQSPLGAVTLLLKENQGICIGESHKSESSKKFLMDNMDALKKRGLDTLFLEHVLSDSHQKELDQYMKSPPKSEMPHTLKAFLTILDKGNEVSPEYGFTRLVEKAKEHQVSVVAFDTNASYFSHNPNSFNEVETQQRCQNMNYLAKKAIDAKQGEGKWILFAGSAHISKHLGVLGVSELTGSPSLVIEDLKKGLQSKIALNVKEYLGTDINPDIVISMPLSRTRENRLTPDGLARQNAQRGLSLSDKDSKTDINLSDIRPKTLPLTRKEGIRRSGEGPKGRTMGK